MAKLAKILVIPLRNHERSTDQRTVPKQDQRRARWVFVASLVGAVGLYGAGAILSHSEQTASIRNLPVEAQRALVARTVDELGTICGGPAAAAGDLREHCVAQARFVLQIPECTDACQRAAIMVLPHAGR